jgi:hypothetical protein
MSALGQKQTCASHKPMSALGQKLDIAFLFDDFIGGRDQRPGYFKTKRLSGFEIDDQFKLGCLHD